MPWPNTSTVNGDGCFTSLLLYTVQAVCEAEEAKEDAHPVRFCALAFVCADMRCTS